MQLPLIHLNGTSKDSLTEDVWAAWTALEAAITTVVNARPNARDYYPLGPDAFKTAAKEHEARVEKLVSVQKELQALAEGIEQGGWKRS